MSFVSSLLLVCELLFWYLLFCMCLGYGVWVSCGCLVVVGFGGCVLVDYGGSCLDWRGCCLIAVLRLFVVC